MRDRLPAVAGRFYPGEAGALRRAVSELLAEATPAAEAHPVLGMVAPHAGYVYSGGVAGAVFARARIPDCVVVMGPNHTGMGPRASLRARGDWLTPGARVPVDEPVCDAVLKAARGLVEADERAHQYEHALEVELPLLHARNPSLRIVPITLGPLDLDACRRLGRVLADCLPEGALVVASSDMNHYLPDDVTRKRDRMAIDPMLAREPAALFEVVVREDLSMCGFIPATIMLEFANARAARQAELVRYATSGEAFGDYERVVGYAGIAVTAQPSS